MSSVGIFTNMNSQIVCFTGATDYRLSLPVTSSLNLQNIRIDFKALYFISLAVTR